MPKRIYNGPCPEVEVVLPDGSHPTVKRGESIDVPEEVAANLDSQGDTWLANQPAAKAPKKRKANAAPTGAPPEGESPGNTNTDGSEETQS
jgi:hypothetical protein